MNDGHALGKLCRSWEGAGAGDQVLKNAWRIGRTFPKGQCRLGTQPALLLWAIPARQVGYAASRLSARLLSGPAAGLGVQRAQWARSSAPPSFRFGPPPAIGRGSRAPPRPRPPLVAPPLGPTPPHPTPAGILGEGAGRADPGPGLGAASNAPKRRGERAGEEGRRLGSEGEGERRRLPA